MQREANSTATQATCRYPKARMMLAPIVIPYMKLVQALEPTSRTNGDPSSGCLCLAFATICCERPGNPCVLEDETITASSVVQASRGIKRSSNSAPTATGDCSGSKKRRARRPVFVSIRRDRSRVFATMSAAASSSMCTFAVNNSPISRFETIFSGRVLAVQTIEIALDGKRAISTFTSNEGFNCVDRPALNPLMNFPSSACHARQCARGSSAALWSRIKFFTTLFSLSEVLRLRLGITWDLARITRQREIWVKSQTPLTLPNAISESLIPERVPTPEWWRTRLPPLAVRSKVQSPFRINCAA